MITIEKESFHSSGESGLTSFCYIWSMSNQVIGSSCCKHHTVPCALLPSLLNLSHILALFICPERAHFVYFKCRQFLTLSSCLFCIVQLKRYFTAVIYTKYLLIIYIFFALHGVVLYYKMHP